MSIKFNKKIAAVAALGIALGLWVGINGTMYYGESLNYYQKDVYDKYTLLQIADSIEDISLLEAGVVYQGNVGEQYFEAIDVATSGISQFFRLSSVRSEIDEISDWVREPLTQSQIDYLARVGEELNAYCNELDAYQVEVENDFVGRVVNRYILRDTYDKDCQMLKAIFVQE